MPNIVMSVVVLIVDMLNIFVVNVDLLNIIILYVVMLNVVMLTGVMPNGRMSFVFFTKQAILARRLIVLSISLSVRLPWLNLRCKKM